MQYTFKYKLGNHCFKSTIEAESAHEAMNKIRNKIEFLPPDKPKEKTNEMPEFMNEIFNGFK
jgi:hypothetical protein